MGVSRERALNYRKEEKFRQLNKWVYLFLSALLTLLWLPLSTEEEPIKNTLRDQ